ncbi:MAG: SGNH/GDSL hydrolase family protein [Christensenellaceae bacterium]|jgi:lysophospholipase L1-like esterase|nr:SGNH/GDSL hydrolase family protein [Christensenellaceae bacterium]
MTSKDCEISIFGDSLALGYVFNNLVPTRLPHNAVSVISDKLGIEIKNYSVFGQTLKRVCDKGTLERYLEACSGGKKRIAVIALGGNDSDYYWEKVAENPDFPHDCKTNLAQFITMLNNKITLLKDSGVTPVLVNLIPIDSKNYFKNILSKKYDGKKLLKFFRGDVNVIHRHQEVFSNEVTRAAIENDCKLLDIRSKLLWHHNLKSLMHTDGIHLNEKGQRFIAEEILKMIES